MKLTARVLALVAPLFSCAPAAPPAPAFPAGPVVDLSHIYDDKTIFWPTAAPFTLKTVADGVTPAGFYYAANSFTMDEHGGTHLDAPRHFASGRWTVDEIPIERFIGPAVVVDVTTEAQQNPDYQITADDLLAWERDHGAIPPDAMLLFRTGFSARWPDPRRYLGTAERGPGAVASLHFPGVRPDAARWLVERRPRAVGIDTASIDYGQSTLFESHRILFDRNIPAFENLTALERLPATGAIVAALPMKIGRGSGAPLRAIAILPVR
jgi:kynurenine formamidase